MAHILIADDQYDIRHVMRRALEQEKHTVLEACNGNETLQILKNEKIDLLIMDLVMPNISGLETLVDLRSDPRTIQPELKIMLMTGAIDISQRFFIELVARFKVSQVLEKPFGLMQLKDEVRKILSN